jgi:hypothetical protein
LCQRIRFMVGVLFLELGWWDVAEAFVQAGVVEPAEVFDDRELELRAGAPDGSAISSVLKESTNDSASALS